jgi:hypothetical protein
MAVWAEQTEETAGNLTVPELVPRYEAETLQIGSRVLRAVIKPCHTF